MIFGSALYQRYLIREAMASIVLVLAAFLALFSFFDMVGEMRSISDEGYQFFQALIVVVLRLPGMIYELIPIAVLIGTLYALSTLARHSEITVMRASGLSTRALLLTLFRMAGVFALLTFLVGEFVAPASERLGREFQARAMSRVVATQGFSSGIWLKDGRSFINVREALPDSALRGVRIYQFGSGDELVSVTDAEEADFDAAGHWNLRRGQQTQLTGDVVKLEKFESQAWHSAFTPNLLAVLMVAPDRMSAMSLVRYISHLSDNKQKSERYQIALWKKIIYPLAALVMVALALPFGYSHDRVGGVSLKIFAGIMLGILFYALNGLFSNLGVINAWPPFASAVAPSALFLMAAIALLWWVERR